MEVLVALTVGILVASATYLLLSRNVVRLILGLVLIGNAANLTIFAGGRLGATAPPLVGADPGAAMANALPQALILTAIVISFALIAFTMGLIYRAHTTLATVDTEDMRLAEPPDEPPSMDAGDPPPLRLPPASPPRRRPAAGAAE